MKVIALVVGIAVCILIWRMLASAGQIAEQQNNNVIQVRAEASKVIHEYNQQQEKQLSILKEMANEPAKKKEAARVNPEQ